jgi:hypothetical protein
MMTGVLHETRTRGGKDEVLAMAVPGHERHWQSAIRLYTLAKGSRCQLTPMHHGTQYCTGTNTFFQILDLGEATFPVRACLALA